MIVTFDDGTKKDMHYSVVASLLKQNKISVENLAQAKEPTEVLNEPKKGGASLIINGKYSNICKFH